MKKCSVHTATLMSRGRGVYIRGTPFIGETNKKIFQRLELISQWKIGDHEFAVESVKQLFIVVFPQVDQCPRL